MLDEKYMPKWYILDENNKPVRTNDYGMIEKFLKSDRKITAQTRFRGYEISTVFLGLDHSIPFRSTSNEPLLWETMIFRQGDRSLEEFLCRYPTRKRSIKGHKEAIDWLEDKINSGELPEYERCFTDQEQQELYTKRLNDLGPLIARLENKPEQEVKPEVPHDT